MTYKIEQIEGIGPQYGQQLMLAGISTSDDLLAKCATPDGLRAIELKTGLSAKQLTTWRNQADLMRVSGIGSEFGQLLEAAGVESVAELARRSPENIVNLLDRVNAEKKLTRAVPALKTVTKWIQQAVTVSLGATEPFPLASPARPVPPSPAFVPGVTTPFASGGGHGILTR